MRYLRETGLIFIDIQFIRTILGDFFHRLVIGGSGRWSAVCLGHWFLGVGWIVFEGGRLAPVRANVDKNYIPTTSIDTGGGAAMVVVLFLVFLLFVSWFQFWVYFLVFEVFVRFSIDRYRYVWVNRFRVGFRIWIWVLGLSSYWMGDLIWKWWYWGLVGWLVDWSVDWLVIDLWLLWDWQYFWS